MVLKLFRLLGILSSSRDPAAVWKIQSDAGKHLKIKPSQSSLDLWSALEKPNLVTAVLRYPTAPQTLSGMCLTDLDLTAWASHTRRSHKRDCPKHCQTTGTDVSLTGGVQLTTEHTPTKEEPVWESMYVSGKSNCRLTLWLALNTSAIWQLAAEAFRSLV